MKQVEIVEFYPLTQGSKAYVNNFGNVLIGSLTARIIGMFEVKKIEVFKSKEGELYFSTPSFKFVDDDGKKGRCPYFNFLEKSQSKFFMDCLKKEGREFIKKRLKEKKNDRR